MSGTIYDIDKLAQSGQIDTTLIGRFFYNNQDYFDKLTDFATNHSRSLSHYTPAFVVNSEEDRDRFLSDCFQVRAMLMQLGMTSALAELNTMEDALHGGNLKDFADGQVKFLANLKIYMDIIKSARLQNQHEPSLPVLTDARKDVPKHTLLVTEPDPAALSFLAGILEPRYHVVGRPSGQAAMTALRLHVPALFLISVHMTGISGYELAYLIRATEQFTHHPIWFMSDPTVFDPVKSSMPPDAANYIKKPIDRENLLHVLEYHFAHYTPSSRGKFL